MILVQLILVLLYPSVYAGLTDICGLNCISSNRVKRRFYVYWNVPTFMCHKYGMNFEKVKRFGIKQNAEDEFRGDIIALLYDPGKFPAMLPVDSNPNKYKKRNGGLPHMGNLYRHGQEFIHDLQKQIPNEDFDGIGVIDFEKWKPVFRQNWGNTEIHKEATIDLIKKTHPSWNSLLVETEARIRFEKHARRFMEETLNIAKRERNKADWGYYGYPYCYNLSPKNPGYECDSKAMNENDKISWLFESQEVLLPSVYLRYFLKPDERLGLVRGRVQEAIRVSNNSRNKPRVIPYWWFKYTDQRDVFLSETDVKSTLKEILTRGGDGIIIWGSSLDVDSESKCKRLMQYVETILGPVVDKVLDVANDGGFTLDTRVDPLAWCVVRVCNAAAVYREIMGSTWHSVTAVVLFLIQSNLLHAHREHKVHNIVLYPDKHSWCKTTPIKQVVAWPQCSSQELDNNVCVGACFSYMVPHSEPSAPGDLIRPYCDSCQPLDSVWHTVTLDCKDEENNPITMQKKVQIITNCSCSSCMETSRIKPDYNTLLQSLTEENLDKNVNVPHETPDLLLDANLNSSKNTTRDGVEVDERLLQLFNQGLKDSEKLDESGAKELFSKFEEEIDLEKWGELLKKYKQENERHQQHQQSSKQQQQQQQQHHGTTTLLHRGPHHSMVLDSGVKEKIDVEPHYLHPAVAGQEISYHDNVLVDKGKKKDF
ncbi:hypothetical protein KPH14_003355 [Odynerus spinipes]|uniref:Hyaluronidase n=1 Tax=Odynerus spinipes TaxID=1348599 RepID=A0AAD9VKK4_9HYME|nr:hypothetical protein KPH14_003355 [Odynerus spinipes]